MPPPKRTAAAQSSLDAVARAKQLPSDKRNQGIDLFINAGKIFENVASTLEAGDTTSLDDYVKALSALIQTIVDTAALAAPPSGSLVAGLEKPDQTGKPNDYFKKRIKWMSLKQATGIDMLMWSATPEPIKVLQQVALGACLVADPRAMANVQRSVVVDLLEDAFQVISDKKTLTKFKLFGDKRDIDIKNLQFCIMRLLCIIYVELLAGDRAKNIRYLFRHAEAAGIMIVLKNDHYAGHLENSWNLLQKITLGIMHVTPGVWEHAKSSAQQATALSARVQHDFAFAPAAYNLVFFLVVGFPCDTFVETEVQLLLQDIERSESRMESWGIKEYVLFENHPKRYLIALKAEWKKEKDRGEAGKKGTGKLKRATLKDALAEDKGPVPKGHLSVTDWRCFDQRFFGFFTYLEPPMQKDHVVCAMCKRPCERIHRCTECKLVAYCSAICTQAHIFEHECLAAPKPWLAPPTVHQPKSPPELGEEGFMGVIPWSVAKYACIVALTWGAICGYRLFDDYRWANKLSVFEAIVQGALLLLGLFQERFLRLFGLATTVGVSDPGVQDAAGALEVEELAQKMRNDLLQRNLGAVDDSWEALDVREGEGAESVRLRSGEGVETTSGSSDDSVCSGGMCSA